MSRYQDILNNIQQALYRTSSEDESLDHELTEYKTDFIYMNLASLKAIAQHAMSIVKAVENNDITIKNNLTESWLQGKIAIAEDHMRTIHDFVMYATESDDKTLAGCGCGGNKKNPQQPTPEPKPQDDSLPVARPQTHEAKPKND